jgi:ABC-2 type transport system permease protein
VGSSGQHSREEALGPFWAIIQADLRSLFKSRITYGWVLAAAFIQVLRTLGSVGSGTPSVVSSGLSDFVYIWSLVIIGLAGSSVSSEAGELADSILSKSVTRLDYVLAKFTSRIAYTLLSYAAITAVLVGLSLKLDVGHYSAAGLVEAVLVMALTLSMLTSLGVGLSVALSNTVVSIVTLLVLWYGMVFFFPIIGLEVISPGSLLGSLSTIISGTWTLSDWETVTSYIVISGAAIGLASLYFHMKDI